MTLPAMTNGWARNPTSNKLTRISTNALRKSALRLGKAAWKPGSRTEQVPSPPGRLQQERQVIFVLFFFPPKKPSISTGRECTFCNGWEKKGIALNSCWERQRERKTRLIAFKTCNGCREELFQTATVSASLRRMKALDEMGGPASFLPPPATTPARGSSGTSQPRAGYFLVLGDSSSLLAHLKRFSAIKRLQCPAGAVWSSRTALHSRLLGKLVPFPHPFLFVCLFPCFG